MQVNIKQIARNISLIENRVPGFEELLLQSGERKAGIVGLTGSPGAGKSTLADALIEEMIADEKRVAVLCIDPSSPFNMGALLGDRVRMSKWYNDERVFIRSMASRNALGGLSPMIIEVTEYLKCTGFDFILVETVGVGQNEIDIAGLADVTVVVMVPEGGDEIQTMKSGIMEIGDVFVVNKCDRPDADRFVRYLHAMLAPVFQRVQKEIPVIKTTASTHEGIAELYKTINLQLTNVATTDRKFWLLADKAYQLIQERRMYDISKLQLFTEIRHYFEVNVQFNLYNFVEQQIAK